MRLFIIAEITPKADIDSNLTAHWNFEETDASGNPVNIGSDSSIKAVLEGNKVSVKDSGDETYGKVLHFEPKGDAAENSRMFIGDMFNPKQEDFSVSLWVNNSSQQVTNQNTIILQFADKDGATGKTFIYRSPEDKYTVYMNGTGIVTSSATSDGKWENITITKENLDNGKYTLKFYINGEQTYTGECDASQVIDKVTDLIIGSHKNKTDKDNGQFTGDIDDLRFYERVLTADDVKALYNAKADEAVNSQLEAAISQADSLYDGMTIHPYAGTPTGGSSNEETKKQFYYSTLSLIPGTVSRVSNLVNEMRTITGDNTKVPAISEYGIYPSYDTMVRSQTHALYIARVLMEYIRLDSPYIQKHCLVDWYSSGGDSLGPTQQAVIQAVPQEGADIITGEGDYKFFSTPSARVFEMYNSASGTDVLSSTFSDTRLLDNGTEQYAAMASKDADGNVYLALVNSKLEGKGVVDIKVDGVDLSGKTLEIQYISGDTFYAENTIDNPDNVDVIRTTDTVAENSETARVVVEPHSFTIVKVVNALVEEPDTPDVTELKNKVEEALPMIDMEEYTAESREVLKTAIDEAQAIIAKAEAGEEVTQTQVDDALKAIENAVNSLELVKPDFILGDADGSGSMTIDDASYIQQYLVKAISADKFVFEAADTNKDGKITVYDATKIQLAIASNEDL